MARFYYRALGNGLYRLFEVNGSGATIREVDCDARALDPYIRQLADERAGMSPGAIEAPRLGEVLTAMFDESDEEDALR